MELRDYAKPRYKSIDDRYPDPCEGCDRKHCDSRGMCRLWKTRFHYRQKAINGFAKKYLIQPIKTDPDEDPCEGCNINYYCDKICLARAKWWDVQMKKLKKELKFDGSFLSEVKTGEDVRELETEEQGEGQFAGDDHISEHE